MDKLLLILLLLAGALWLYEDSLDKAQLIALKDAVVTAEAKVKTLQGELDSARSEYDRAISDVVAANVAINSILDKAGRDIDEGLKGIQRLKAINQSYDAAVVAVRDKCSSAVSGAGAGDI